MISKFDDLFKKYAADYGFDWRLIAAQSFIESSFRADAVSPAGAVGLMQIMPSTAEWIYNRIYGYKLDITPDMLKDPEFNVELGVMYDSCIYGLDLVRDTEDAQNRIKFMLAGYNCGPGRLLQAIKAAPEGKREDYDYISINIPSETQDFVDMVMSKYQEYCSQESCNDQSGRAYIELKDEKAGYSPISIEIKGLDAGRKYPVVIQFFTKRGSEIRELDSDEFNIQAGDIHFIDEVGLFEDKERLDALVKQIIDTGYDILEVLGETNG